MKQTYITAAILIGLLFCLEYVSIGVEHLTCRYYLLLMASFVDTCTDLAVIMICFIGIYCFTCIASYIAYKGFYVCVAVFPAQAIGTLFTSATCIALWSRSPMVILICCTMAMWSYMRWYKIMETTFYRYFLEPIPEETTI